MIKTCGILRVVVIDPRGAPAALTRTKGYLMSTKIESLELRAKQANEDVQEFYSMHPKVTTNEEITRQRDLLRARIDAIAAISEYLTTDAIRKIAYDAVTIATHRVHDHYRVLGTRVIDEKANLAFGPRPALRAKTEQDKSAIAEYNRKWLEYTPLSVLDDDERTAAQTDAYKTLRAWIRENRERVEELKKLPDDAPSVNDTVHDINLAIGTMANKLMSDAVEAITGQTLLQGGLVLAVTGSGRKNREETKAAIANLLTDAAKTQ